MCRRSGQSQWSEDEGDAAARLGALELTAWGNSWGSPAQPGLEESCAGGRRSSLLGLPRRSPLAQKVMQPNLGANSSGAGAASRSGAVSGSASPLRSSVNARNTSRMASRQTSAAPSRKNSPPRSRQTSAAPSRKNSPPQSPLARGSTRRSMSGLQPGKSSRDVSPLASGSPSSHSSASRDGSPVRSLKTPEGGHRAGSPVGRFSRQGGHALGSADGKIRRPAQSPPGRLMPLEGTVLEDPIQWKVKVPRTVLESRARGVAMGSERRLAYALSAISDGDADARRDGAEEIGRVHTTGGVVSEVAREVLLRAVSDRNTRVRAAATEALRLIHAQARQERLEEETPAKQRARAPLPPSAAVAAAAAAALRTSSVARRRSSAGLDPARGGMGLGSAAKALGSGANAEGSSGIRGPGALKRAASRVRDAVRAESSGGSVCQIAREPSFGRLGARVAEGPDSTLRRTESPSSVGQAGSVPAPKGETIMRSGSRHLLVGAEKNTGTLTRSDSRTIRTESRTESRMGSAGTPASSGEAPHAVSVEPPSAPGAGVSIAAGEKSGEALAGTAKSKIESGERADGEEQKLPFRAPGGKGSEQWEARRRAQEEDVQALLAMLPARTEAEGLVPPVESEEAVARQAAALAALPCVAAQDHEVSVGRVAACMHSGSISIRKRAATALKEMAPPGTPAVRRAVCRMLRHKTPETRAAAVRALGITSKLGDEEAIDLLLPALGDETEPVLMSALENVCRVAPVGHTAAMSAVMGALAVARGARLHALATRTLQRLAGAAGGEAGELLVEPLQVLEAPPALRGPHAGQRPAQPDDDPVSLAPAAEPVPLPGMAQVPVGKEFRGLPSDVSCALGPIGPYIFFWRKSRIWVYSLAERLVPNAPASGLTFWEDHPGGGFVETNVRAAEV